MKKVTVIFALLATLSSKTLGQTYYSENFESGLNGWVTKDLDGDTNSWFIDDASGLDGIVGMKSLVSLSALKDVGALKPDNLATSPLINLTAVTASNVILEYDRFVDGGNLSAEHYAIYVTTVNESSAIIATTPVFETIISKSGYYHGLVDLTIYKGKSIYLSYRHFDCTDKRFLIIDNIKLNSLAENKLNLLTANLSKYLLINVPNTLSLNVKNQGGNNISSLTVNWNDGTDHSSVITTSIAVGAEAIINHPTPIKYNTLLQKDIAISITALNGVNEPLPLNNVDSKKIHTISQNSVKKVVFEEGTGTWCGWCPRGAVVMDYMDTNYPNEFIGIAVHQGDPMALPEYINSASFAGYPSMNVDRIAKGEAINQFKITDFFNKRKVLPVPVSLTATGSITGNNIVIKASATFRTVFASANYRLGVIISEDNVTSTTTGYEQSNNYSGGLNGVMGGYETKPNPVPAAQMIYNHVGRALLGGYSGQVDSVPNVITDGQQVDYTFNYTVPATTKIAKIHAIVVLIDQSNGEIINANTAQLSTLSSTQNDLIANKILIFPNPANQKINIQGLESGTYNFEIFDMKGKLVQEIEKVNVELNETKTFDLNNLSKGNYIINTSTQGSSYSKHLIIK